MSKGDPIPIALGRSVRKRREAKDLTQETLAELANLDRTYISAVERGGRNLSRISQGLGFYEPNQKSADLFGPAS